MAQPVWVLSVDLQTKTATFQSGLADAARSARGAFTEIKGGADSMGREVGGSMTEARHGVMLLGEEFGIHLPRALAGFLAGIGPIGAAMEAAFPFLAIIALATIFIEHLAKMREAGESLTTDQVKLGTAIQNAFNQLDEKLLQAQIRSDELRNDHLGALRHQLELIDKQSMGELVHSFEEVAKAADVVFGELKTSWYQFGTGSRGAKHALEEFQNEYNSLLAQGKDKDASDLLKGTKESAERILALQKQADANKNSTNLAGMDQSGDHAKYTAAFQALSAAKVGYTEKEIQAQQALVDALTAQVGIEEKIAALKKLEGGNAGKQAGNEGAAQAASAARAAAESQARIGEQAVAADKAVAEEQLSIRRATIQERLAVDLEFATRERDLQLTTNQAEIAALDKSGKDYANQLKALKEKGLEIAAQYAANTTELTAKAGEQSAAKELRDLEQSEREKIDATMKGSAARIAALDAAIKEEEGRNLQDTSTYRDLLSQRVEAVREAAEEEGKLREQAGQEGAEAFKKAGDQMVAAEKQQDALVNSARRTSDAERMAQDLQLANEEFAIQMVAYAKEAAGLDKNGKDYENKLKALQDKEKQLVQQHENEITAIKEKAEEERNARILSAERQLTDTLASGLTKSIMGHQAWAKMITSFGDEAVAGMIKNSLMVLMQQDKERLGDARKAATSAYATGEQIGGPAGIVLGPVFAAAAFAGVMAFESGGVVPGVGTGDIVPAMLTPGEGVIPKSVMEGLSNMAKFGSMGGSTSVTHVHIHHSPTIQALDSEGMDSVLEKNTAVLQKHFERTLRRMNH